MTTEEAKFILQVYRPNGQDASDPAFAEALEQARLDPELGRWFDEERALDAVLTSKLRAIPIPAQLKPLIRTGGSVVAPRQFRTRRAVLMVAALAAGLAVLVTSWRLSAPGGFDSYRLHVATMIEENTYALNYSNPKLASVRDWLKEHQGQADFQQLASLSDRPTFGCQVFTWKGRPVTLVCFQSSQGIVHLFVTSAAGLADAPAEGAPEIASVANQQVASWTKGGKIYVLAGMRSFDSLKKLL